MKIPPILIGIMIVSFALGTITSAKSSDIFIDYLTDMVYEDCQGNDIQINQPYIINIKTNESVDVITWPYGYQDLRRIIELFGEIEPFAFFQGSCENKGVSISGADGCGILTCQNNRLDINQYTYFWNGIRVAVPKEEFKTTFGPNSPIVETHGDKSPVTTGDNSPITQKENNILNELFWSKGTIGGLIVAGVLNIIYIFVKKHRFKSP
jgi:hypothetical protein